MIAWKGEIIFTLFRNNLFALSTLSDIAYWGYVSTVRVPDLASRSYQPYSTVLYVMCKNPHDNDGAEKIKGTQKRLNQFVPFNTAIM